MSHYTEPGGGNLVSERLLEAGRKIKKVSNNQNEERKVFVSDQ